MTRTQPPVRLAAALGAVLAAVALAGCANPIDAVTSALGTPSVEEALAQRSSTTTAQLSSPTIIQDGTLTVGLDTAASAPMCITGSDGSFQGYDVDIASALAGELGLDVTFVSVSDPSSAVGTTCDVVMGVQPDRAGSLTVVGGYAEDATAFFHRGSATTVSRGEIEGTTVGVQEGSASFQLLKRSDLTCEQQSFANLNEAFDALEAGTVDYVLCDAYAGAYLASAYDDLALAGTLDVPTSMGIVTDPENTELQTAVKQALDKLSSGGVGDIVRAKWLGGMEALTDTSQVAGITISAGTVEGASDTAEVTGGTSGVQDGSTAGANAVDIGDE